METLVIQEELLKDLPIDHPLRNTPLITIGAFYRGTRDTIWREVFPNFNIASKTYNDLGKTWIEGQEWKNTQHLPHG
jgi:hypothetical protein